MSTSYINKAKQGNINFRLSSFFKFLAVISIFVYGTASSAEDTLGPSNVVNGLHYKLIDVMRSNELQSYEDRYEALEPVISSHFDTPLIAKVILSRYWGNLDEKQKAEFIELFNKLSIATYASRFDSYSGERFVEISREKLKRGRLLVKTELQRIDDKPVKLDYLMHQKGDAWYIISVIANGVNDLSLKRAEYAAVIKDKGYDALVEDVIAKIRDMENEANS